MDPLIELNEADEIVRRILARQNVSDDEFRYAVMFNLTAMTQLLWELSNAQVGPTKIRPEATLAGSYYRSGRASVRKKVMRLVPLAAMVAFLAGLGLGYIIP